MSRSGRDTQAPPGSGKQAILIRGLEEGISRTLAGLIACVYRLSGDRRDWCPLLARFSAHVAVLAVALLGTTLSTIEWPSQAAPTLSASGGLPALAGTQRPPESEPLAEDTPLRLAQPVTVRASGDDISRQPNPHTIVPKRPRLEIVTYTVEAGDTIQSIAKRFDLEPTTIMWSNPAVEDTPDLLRIGQEIVILPIDGVYHQVEEEDTLASIAEAYEVEPDAIAQCPYNGLAKSGRGLQQGTYLIVPEGTKPYEPRTVTAYVGPVPEGARGTGRFQWPVLGMITQGYWYGHRAIDIGAPTGSAVLSTDGGFVSFAGWTDVGYGYLIVIDHANSFATYYAHLSNIYVAEGQAVDRGQVIGAVGSTGNSTGPHLHFEVRRYNTQQNPRAYLP